MKVSKIMGQHGQAPGSPPEEEAVNGQIRRMAEILGGGSRRLLEMAESDWGGEAKAFSAMCGIRNIMGSLPIGQLLLMSQICSKKCNAFSGVAMSAPLPTAPLPLAFAYAAGV